MLKFPGRGVRAELQIGVLTSWQEVETFQTQSRSGRCGSGRSVWHVLPPHGRALGLHAADCHEKSSPASLNDSIGACWAPHVTFMKYIDVVELMRHGTIETGIGARR
eukprot:6435634-Amphidinium_carterae.1